ncbi:MAG: hypothetical protein E7359_02435 [Clostridiales bacterium]|nr:hypothetical protein [Clostridiales bacterium]
MENTKKENYKIVIKYVIFFILFLILSLGEINFSIRPFLFAFLFSLVWCNQNPIICSVFYIIANLIFMPFSINLIIPLVFTCLFLNGVYFLHKKLNKKINRYLFLVYAFLSQFAFLFYSFTTPENLINSIISVLIGLILIICYNTFFSSVFIKGFSSVFTINELISGSVFLLSLSVGISNINILNVEFIKVFAVFLILFSTFTLSSKSTFTIAVVVGLGEALSSYNLTLVSVFSIFSLISICFKTNNKYFSCLAICLIDIFLGLYLKVYSNFSIYSMLSIVLGCILFLAIPNKILNTFKNLFGGFNTTLLYRNLINSTKDSIIKRLNEISEVFLDMEINFKNMIKGNLPKNEAKQMLINEMCTKVCSDCKEHTRCLRNLGEETIKSFDDMFEKGFERGKVTLLDIPSNLSTRCNRSANIISSMNGLLNSYKQYSFMINSQDTSKILIGEQMGGVSRLLKNLIEDTTNNFNFDFSKETEIKEELKFLHLYCSDVITYVKDGYYIVNLIIKKDEYNYSDIENLVSKILKIKMKITNQEELNNNFNIITIKNAPIYDCIFGMSAITKENSEISGDTYSFIKIDENKVLMALNDGMGSGENAQKTSELSLNLIENFYRAGFENDIILNSVNKLLTINSEETFSALDICVLDFNKAIIDFIKLGAPIGFLKNENNIEEIESGSLPIGILEEISPVITKKTISGNEIIILISDGVLENFKTSENLKMFISSINSVNPQIICDKIIEECKKFEIEDDCTVLALRIFNVIE